MQTRYKLVSSLFVAVLLVNACCLHPKKTKQKRLTFTSGGNELSGWLITPGVGRAPFPTLIFVHGDGAARFDAYGVYLPIWEALAARGIASFSWDKPGVGLSTGDWQLQSMAERAQEVVAAIKCLNKSGEPVAQGGIGVIGFSQAGWVLPLLTEAEIQPKYMVFVSTAVNWVEQGEYFTRVRLKGEGWTEADITSFIAQEQRLSRTLEGNSSYEDYLRAYEAWQEGEALGIEEPMTARRYEFVKKNWHSDASSHIAKIKVPVLVLFGENDLNVDVENTTATYRKVFKRSEHNDYSIKVFPNSTHNLTRADYMNPQMPGISFAITARLLGADFYSEGVLDYLGDWVSLKSEKGRDTQ